MRACQTSGTREGSNSRFGGGSERSSVHARGATEEEVRTGVRSPVDADDRDVLQEDKVQRELFMHTSTLRYREPSALRPEGRCADLFNGPCGKADNDCTALPCDALERVYPRGWGHRVVTRKADEMRTSNEPDRVVDDVHALASSEFQDLFLPALFRVVHAMVRSTVSDGDVQLLLRARSRDDFRT